MQFATLHFSSSNCLSHKCLVPLQSLFFFPKGRLLASASSIIFQHPSPPLLLRYSTRVHLHFSVHLTLVHFTFLWSLPLSPRLLQMPPKNLTDSPESGRWFPIRSISFLPFITRALNYTAAAIAFSLQHPPPTHRKGRSSVRVREGGRGKGSVQREQ